MRILLVEDEPDLGRAIKRTLTQEAYVVDWVQSGDEALAYLESSSVTYVLGVLDWMLPGQTGPEICRWLRARQNALPILMLTAKERIEDRIAGLDAGADDYLVKPFSMNELLARLRALRRRPADFVPAQIQVGALTLDCDRRIALLHNNTPSEQSIKLTQKEFQLLQCLMERPDRILTQEQVFNHLWEFDSEPISNVVAAQVRLLRRKLGQYGYDHMIETVYGMGYRLKAE